ncbi:hypothetical protein [Winogradskyella luteola]|uniref:Uncharacterized protein n=1 Tax=Winogradskyella luteola TaxID=2828330 RepID=A0A9X1JPY2_9FLAO|nr:hypothetical protein [Winogradskyella luteola]MBV7268403.1 hypothetical protein [Winogradskyella luteola]
MTRAIYIKHLLNILSYDTLIDLLTIADRYWLHRQIIINYGNPEAPALVNETPYGHILNISNMIKERNWKRPLLRYNSYRELEESEDHGRTWKPFDVVKYITKTIENDNTKIIQRYS